MPRPPLELDPATTALLIIETQEGVVGRSSTLPDIAVAAAPILPRIAALANGMRNAGAQVVHLTYVPALGNRSSNRAPVMFQAVLPLMQTWQPDGPEAQPVQEVGVGDGDLVLPRHSGLSPTYNTEIFPMLRNAGYTTVVLAGVSLNIAVPLVAAQATDENFTAIVATDAVAGTPAEHAESILRNTIAFIARLASVDAVLAALGGAH